MVALRSAKKEISTEEILQRARTGVSLGELDIVDSRVRKSANGSVLVEVFGTGKTPKAEFLARRLRDLLKEDAVVSRPYIKGELRLVDIDSCTTSREICDVI